MLQTFLESLTPIEAIGYLGTFATIVTYAMSNMIPLRIAGLLSSGAFLTYGILTKSWPVVATEAILLPLNGFRLWQMIRLVRKVREASEGDLSMSWLEPYSKKRAYKAGDVLFRRTDVAKEMFYILSGRFAVPEIHVTMTSGQVFGEIGLISEGNRRTQTLVCVEDGEVLTLDYRSVREMYSQNPEFGFYFLRLVTARLMADLKAAEARALPQAH